MLEIERLKDYPSLNDLHQQDSCGKSESTLINYLEKQIDYLKGSKIIEMLISEKKPDNFTQVSHNNELQKLQNFQHPKKLRKKNIYLTRIVIV